MLIRHPNLPTGRGEKCTSAGNCDLGVTISAGSVVALEAVSGHPLLIPAAIDAVKQ